MDTTVAPKLYMGGNVAMREDIELKTEDGIKLRGWHYLPEKRTGKVPTILWLTASPP